MSLLSEKLKTRVGQEIVVVMRDNRAFRGTLVEYDAETLVLRSVVEALPNNTSGWEEPTASTGIVHKVVTWRGTFSHEDTEASVVKLKDVMVRIPHVLRVWDWSMVDAERPEHVEVSDATEPRPGRRVSRSG